MYTYLSSREQHSFSIVTERWQMNSIVRPFDVVWYMVDEQHAARTILALNAYE